MEQTDITGRIRERYPGMSKGQKKIAAYILEHYDQAAYLTAAKLGERLSVSESTVVRFAAALGYDGYPGMQEALAGLVSSRLGQVNRVGENYRDKTIPQVIDSVLESDRENLLATRERLDEGAFETAVDSILSARTVYVLGIRSCAPLAQLLAYYLNMLRGSVVLVTSNSMTEVFEQILRIDREDVLIGISFPRYSLRTLKAMEYANDQNARVISVTDSANSPLNLYSSCNLFASSSMVSIVDSLAAPVSLINALIVALCLKNPGQVRDSLEHLNEVWRDYQTQLNDELNLLDEDSVGALPEWMGKRPGKEGEGRE